MSNTNTRNRRRPQRSRIQCKPVQNCYRFRRILGQGLSEWNTDEAEIRARATHRLHFLYGGRGTRVCRFGRGLAGFSYFDIEIDIPFRKATVCFRSRIWVFGREYFPLSPIYQYRDGVRADSCNWYPITLL